MCGGIVGALTLGLKPDIRRSPARLFPYLLAYNVGRIATYAIAGAAVGYVSAQILRIAPPEQARLIAKLVSGGFMLLLGFISPAGGRRSRRWRKSAASCGCESSPSAGNFCR